MTHGDLNEDILTPLAFGVCAPIDSFEPVAFDDFASALRQTLDDGGRVLSLFARSTSEAQQWTLVAVLARRHASEAAGQDPARASLVGGDYSFSLGVVCARVGQSYPSLTPRSPALHLFERDLHERCGIVPEGHPWLRPVRHWPSDGGDATQPWPMYELEGPEVHEVRVGPVHAGVIEPGHFRFQCHGERVFRLEIALGFQHRGLLAQLVGGPHCHTLAQMETVAGDTSVGHAWAHAQVVEALSQVCVSPRADALRACGLELERLANHVGDLGALAGDVGFLPTASYCGGLRGDLLNLSAMISGSRLGRGLVRVGGVGFDLDDELTGSMRERLRSIGEAAERANLLLWASPSSTGRFEGTGTVPPEVARSLGLVGFAARASGVDIDVRRCFPTQTYSDHPVRHWLKEQGDVYARGRMRWREAEASFAFLDQVLDELPEGDLRVAPTELSPDSLAVGLVEGWRGEICHIGLTDAQGRFEAYEIVDPSFHNWTGLEMALRGAEISDFPLCNKSFNLSYAGHDL